MLVSHAGRASAVEDDFADQRTGDDVEVRTVSNRIQIHPCSVRSFSVSPGRAVGAAEPLLLPTIHVFGLRITGFDPGTYECITKRIRHLTDRYGQRPIGTVIVVRPERVRFGTLEVRQNLGVRPAATSRLSPTVVVTSVATDVHHAVDGGRAAQHPAPRVLDASVVQMRFRLALILPVETRSLDRPGKRTRHFNAPVVVLRSRLQQQYVVLGTIRESVGENRAGRARADNDEVVVG